MRSQRAQLEGELRASVQNDDITESLARFFLTASIVIIIQQVDIEMER